MKKKNAFFINRLNDNIYPLTYSVKVKKDADILYFTVASLEDIYSLIRDRLNAYLYIFDVGHYMEKDGIYLTLKEIAEKNNVAPDFIYEDDIIAIKKEKFKKLMNFPQRDFEMFDCGRIMEEGEFKGFFGPAKERVKNEGVFIEAENAGCNYYVKCHDNAMLYCETKDFGLKNELLKTMLHDYFEAYLEKNYNGNFDIIMPPREIIDKLFETWNELKIREENTLFRNN